MLSLAVGCVALLALLSAPTAASRAHRFSAAAAPSGGASFVPAADSYVSAAKPRANYGSATRLKDDASPAMNTYLRFDLGSVTGVTRAVLSVYTLSRSTAGFEVHAVADHSWQESSITYANAPPISPSVAASSGGFKSGVWTSVDVTSLVPSTGGPLDIALTTPAATVLTLASRESGGRSPVLAIQTTAVDSIPPTPPSNLAVTAVSGSSIWISWGASTDAVGVSGYDVYANGTRVGSTSGTSFTVSGLACGTSYTLAVDAYDAAGNRSAKTSIVAATSPCADTVPPSAPSALAVTSTTTSSLALFWSASLDNVGVAGYDLYLNGTKVGTTTGTSYTFSGLACGTSYTLGVEAFDAAGNRSSRASLVAATSACPDSKPPAAPTGLAVSGATQTSLNLSWSASSDNVGVAGYDVYLNNTKVGSTTATSYSFTSLSCGTTYTLGVVAYDAAGNRSTQTSVSTATSACAAVSGAPPYRYLYNSGSDPATAAANGWNLIDAGSQSAADALPVGTSGLLWVGDYDNSKCAWQVSDATIKNTVTAAVGDPHVFGYFISDEPNPYACPNAPSQHKARSDLIHSIDPTKPTVIVLDSNGFTGYESQDALNQIPLWKGTATYIGLDPYPCYQGSPCDFSWIDRFISAADAAGIDYWGVVQAFSDTSWRWPTVDELQHMLGQWGSSHESGSMVFAWTWAGNTLSSQPTLLSTLKQWNLGATAAVDATPPSAPSGLTKTGSTQTSISLSWTASTDNVAVTGYNLYRDGASVTSTTSTSYTFGSLACGTSYTLGVEAKDAVGNVSTRSTLSASTSACSKGDTTPPSAPTGLTATGATTTSVSLSWNASSDNVGVTGYGVYVNGTLTGSTAQTSYTLGSLACGKSYPVAVDAYDAAGNRSPQATLTVATSPCADTTAPTAPGTPTVTSATQTSVAVLWTASLDNVGVAGYDVFVNGTKVGTTTATSYTFGSLTCGTNYTLGVEAFDAAGNRSTRSTVAAATNACADTQPPTMPSNLTKTGATTTGISVSWSASSDNVGVTGYDVYVNSTKVASTTSTNYSFGSLTCGTSYTLGVEAFDAAGNHSTRATLSSATAACPTGSDPVITAAGDICGTTTDCAPTAALIGQINPTRVLTLGDNAYPDGSSSDYSTYYAPNWGQYLAKTSPAPGNHDYHTSGAPGYFGYFGSQAPAAYYSYDLGSWHLISLNGEIPISAGSAQETWLKNDLAAHSGQCILAYWHEPRWSSGTTHGSDSSFDAFWRDLYAAGGDIVLNGHEHNYERFAPQNPSGVADPKGIREFVVGTGGASHYSFGTPLATSEVRNDSTFGVLKLTLHPGSYDWQFVPVAGSTFTDSGSGAC